MADIKIVIPRNSFKNLSQLYKDFAKNSKQTIQDVLLEEGALTCREAMVYTPPVDGKFGGQGLTKNAENWGNKAIEYDIRSFVTPVNKYLAYSIDSFSDFKKWKNTVNPDLDRGNTLIARIRRDANEKRAYQTARNLLAGKAHGKIQILKTISNIRTKHNELRKMYKGRIRRNGGPKLMQPYVAEERDIKDYIKTRQQKVGWMKAGWFDCIRKIPKPKINGIEKNFGVKGVNQFITRHYNGSGMTKLDIGMGQNDKVYFTVANMVGNVFSIADLADVRNKVVDARGNKMFRRMEHFYKAAIDRANKGIRYNLD